MAGFVKVSEELVHALMLDQRVTGAHLRCVLCLLCHVNKFTNTAWPSLATISRETGLDRRRVTRSLRDLESWQYMRRAKQDGGQSTRYVVGVLQSTQVGALAPLAVGAPIPLPPDTGRGTGAPSGRDR